LDGRLAHRIQPLVTTWQQKASAAADACPNN